MAPLFRLLLPALLPLFPTLTTAWTDLSDETLARLPNPSDTDFDITSGALLSPILIPRVPGTEGSLKVLSHFQNFFATKLPDWKTSTQNSTATTPTSNGAEIPFVNFYATRDPPWAGGGDVGRLVLVAHYDSKSTPEGFIGATDSAVPCAVLMHAAQAVDEALTRKWEDMRVKGLAGDGLGDGDGHEDAYRGVMILFLDGEEAFHSWTNEDSLYGARSLAKTWESTPHTVLSQRKNHISSIDLFLLLDLLGSKSPTIPSYFPTTHWAYTHMAALESRLRRQNHFLSHETSPNPWFFEPKKGKRFNSMMIQDDHIPFLARGVEVLHVIPSPFPRVWHVLEDDGKHLDMPTVKDWARLTAAFLAGWLGLEGFVEAPLEVIPVGGRAGEAEDVTSGAVKGRGVRLKTEL
ncbi:peptidase family M28-domain-containing protein [Tuber indicum]|nr:peptidase family M28-domain-containing protein [Tuber indicum]